MKERGFSEIEIAEEREKVRREWERKSAVKCYAIGDIEGGRIYENQRGNRRVIVKVFEKFAYVIEEEVRE